ncbi:MAG TPA: hypothetical protein VGL23_22895, partial [Chloroflexota bacterium]
MIVDAHAHVIPPEVLGPAPPPGQSPAPGDEWRPVRVDRPGAGMSVLEVGGAGMPNVRHEFVEIDGMLATLAGLGVEAVVLAPHVGLFRYGAPAEEGLASSQLQNDAIAA